MNIKICQATTKCKETPMFSIEVSQAQFYLRATSCRLHLLPFRDYLALDRPNTKIKISKLEKTFVS